MRQLSIQVTICKSKPLKVKLRSSTVLVHTEQQAIKGPKMTSGKPLKKSIIFCPICTYFLILLYVTSLANLVSLYRESSSNENKSWLSSNATLISVWLTLVMIPDPALSVCWSLDDGHNPTISPEIWEINKRMILYFAICALHSKFKLYCSFDWTWLGIHTYCTSKQMSPKHGFNCPQGKTRWPYYYIH